MRLLGSVELLGPSVDPVEPFVNDSGFDLVFTFNSRNLSHSLKSVSRLKLRDATLAVPLALSLLISLTGSLMPIQGLLLPAVGRSLMSVIFSAFSLSTASRKVAPKLRFLMCDGFGSSTVDD